MQDFENHAFEVLVIDDGRQRVEILDDGPRMSCRARRSGTQER